MAALMFLQAIKTDFRVIHQMKTNARLGKRRRLLALGQMNINRWQVTSDQWTMRISLALYFFFCIVLHYRLLLSPLLLLLLLAVAVVVAKCHRHLPIRHRTRQQLFTSDCLFAGWHWLVHLIPSRPFGVIGHCILDTNFAKIGTHSYTHNYTKSACAQTTKCTARALKHTHRQR